VHYWQHREIKIRAGEHARKDIFKFEEIQLSPSIAGVFSLARAGRLGAADDLVPGVLSARKI